MRLNINRRIRACARARIQARHFEPIAYKRHDRIHFA